MAKNLKAGQTIENEYGDIWNDAILVVDLIDTDWNNQTCKLKTEIYKNEDARTNLKKSYLARWHTLDRTTFLANFDINAATKTLKASAESYALTIEVDGNLLYGDQFE